MTVREFYHYEKSEFLPFVVMNNSKIVKYYTLTGAILEELAAIAVAIFY
jgi:hypothetical protein